MSDPASSRGLSRTVSLECQTDVVAGDGWAFFAGRLLVAAPQIEEETFRRSVVLLLHHDEEGAQGVILNRPLEADIDAVLPGWKSVASTPKTVFQGGPVELNSAIGLVTFAHFVFKLNAVLAFWLAYILTRPLGASIGDFMSQNSHKYGGLGLGTTGTSYIFLGGIFALVAYLSITKRDQTPPERIRAEEHRQGGRLNPQSSEA